MEKYDMTFIDYLKNIHPTYADLGPIFSDLCTSLEYFQETYKFNHKDMKADNLMMKGNKIKYIDFGYSILNFNNIQYSAKLYDAYNLVYFSKVQDLLILSLYLIELLSEASEGGMPNKMPPWVRPRGKTLELYIFLNIVIQNKYPSKVYTLKNSSLNLNGKLTYRQIELQQTMILKNIREFKSMPRFFQVGYNFDGRYLNGQFEFPFATPIGFLELFNQSPVDPDGKYVENILYPKKNNSKEGGKRRINRRTMKKRTI
jgi:serine/threonine protein kinase